MAAIGQKGMPGYGLGFSGSVGTINQVDSIGFLMDKPIGSPVLEIRNLRLTMTPEDSVLSPVPLVDEFGQWIPAEWVGKAAAAEDLQAAWNEEDKALRTDRFKVSEYGGYLETRAAAAHQCEPLRNDPFLLGYFVGNEPPWPGRGDGENYNIGMVDVTDRPYRDLVDAARETHARLYEIHSGKTAPVDRMAKIQ